MGEPPDATRAPARILAVDDDPAQAETLVQVLRRAGHEAETAGDAERALAWVDAGGAPDLVVADLRMAGTDGIGLLQALKRRDPLLEVVLVTAYGSVESAVEAVRAGAYDFLLKPVDRARLLSCVQRALERRALLLENRSLRRAVRQSVGNDPMLLGCSAAFRTVLDLVERAAPTDANVLLTGESGTGKSGIARLVHERSGRGSAPFVKVSCAALPETLLEAELFGHERGAFTGAFARRRGRVEQAHGGTLFLDEVAEIPLGLQVKLLRLVQDREFERVGGERTLRSDFRLVAATNSDLGRAVAERRFREDLYYRLKVVEIELPPLRERSEDVPLLAAHFVQLHAARSRKRVRGIAPETLEVLRSYAWPGNVRELDHVLERAVILTRNDRIERGDLPEALLAGEPMDCRPAADAEGPRIPWGMPLRKVERILIEGALERSGGSVAEAARLLGISERTVSRRRSRAMLPQVRRVAPGGRRSAGVADAPESALPSPAKVPGTAGRG